jgi:hypothetical protein
VTTYPGAGDSIAFAAEDKGTFMYSSAQAPSVSNVLARLLQITYQVS